MRVTHLSALCALAFSRLALGADVDARATTLMIASPELTSSKSTTQTLVPFYERASLSVRKIAAPGFDDLAVNLDGWASFLPSEVTLGGDVNLAYVDGLTFNKHLRVRLGRQILTGGSTRMMAVDGAFVEGRGLAGFGLSAFVGHPVVRRFSNYTRGDFATGARLFWSPSTNAQVGVGITHVSDTGAIIRQDLGADGRWHFARQFTLTGALTFSIPEQRMAEFDASVRWQPATQLEVSAGYRRIAPDLFLSRSSIFSVFADTSRDDVGATVTVNPTAWLSIVGDGHAVWLNNSLGYDAALRAQLRADRSSNTTLTALAHRLSIPVNGYTQGRIGARHVLPWGLGLSIDLDLYGLDTPIRGQKLSFSATATATYAITPSWAVGLAVLGGSTPWYERNTELMAKLTWTLPEAR